MFIAKDLGIFKKLGFDVEILAFEGGVKSYRTMVSGDVDVGVGSSAFSIVCRGRGAKAKLILANAPKLEVTMVGQKSVKDINGLRGKKIGIQQPGGFSWVLSMMVLRKAKIKKTEVDFISILSEDVPPLVAEQIDTAMLLVEQEMVARSKKPALHVIARLLEVAPKNLYSVIAVSEESIKNNRKAIVALAKGHIMATRLLYSDPEKVMPILMKYSGLSKNIVTDAHKILVKNCIWDSNHGSPKRG
jgi:ABC-type nitrate/sulfonate/bicarbonate transport system substrate-binding protein